MEAVGWYRKASMLNCAWSMPRLGKLLWMGGGGAARDRAEASKWFRMAAEAGSETGMVYWARALRAADGEIRDPTAAVCWYRKAAGLGSTWAMHGLGSCYWEGDGVGQDLAMAAAWFKKAAEVGGRESMAAYGEALEAGLGAGKDMGGAVQWYERGAALGDGRAMYRLGIALRDGVGGLTNRGMAREWLIKAAAVGEARAAEALARMRTAGGRGARATCGASGLVVRSEGPRGQIARGVLVAPGRVAVRRSWCVKLWEWTGSVIGVLRQVLAGRC
jgi:TPR repeat protein